VIFGDGSQSVDLVYVDDVARANVLAAESAHSDEAFNIGGGREISLKELALGLLIAMDSDLRPEYVAERVVNPVHRRLADTTRARELLGFEAEVGLDEGLRRLVEWWTRTEDPVKSGTTP
jgi:UDP-glucose 4-epimerase